MQLAEQHGISVGTAHRVTALLSSEELVEGSRGRRATVIRHALVDQNQAPRAVERIATDVDSKLTNRRPQDDGIEEIAVVTQLWAITVRGPDGRRYPARHVCEDLNRPDLLRAHLLAITRIECPTGTDRGESWIGDYELEVREPGKEDENPKLTLRWQVS
jgi:hypothetical protein